MTAELGPAIVVVAYNREKPLMRLLDSIRKAHFSQHNIPLIISLDFSGESPMLDITNGFTWNHGPMQIIRHKKHLGLKQHMFTCCELVKQYGTIILLEDDLIVSPYFYSYTLSAIEFYKHDANIAGISLYAYGVTEGSNEVAQLFDPVENGYDAYFMQVPSSWGVVFNHRQWTRFREWRSLNLDSSAESVIPAFIETWGKESWKKVFYNFLIDTNRFLVFPYRSLTSNFEDVGTHSSASGIFQVPVLSLKKNFSFVDFKSSVHKYDAWFEPLPELINQFVSELMNYKYEVDLMGTKTRGQSEWILTTRKGRFPKMQWSNRMQPLVQNLLFNIHGKGIGLYRQEDVYDFTNPDRPSAIPLIPRSTTLSIGVVIPVIESSKDLLATTLKTLTVISYRKLEVLIPCTNKLYPELKAQLTRSAQLHDLNCEIVPIDSDSHISLALQGLALLRSQLRFWISPGTCIDHAILWQINAAFLDFPMTNLAIPLNHRHNWPLRRWNYTLFCANIAKTGKFPSSEGMIFRSAAIKNLELGFNDDREHMLHARCLKAIAEQFWVYPIEVALDFINASFTLTQVEIEEISMPSPNTRYKLYAALHRIFW